MPVLESDLTVTFLLLELSPAAVVPTLSGSAPDAFLLKVTAACLRCHWASAAQTLLCKVRRTSCRLSTGDKEPLSMIVLQCSAHALLMPQSGQHMPKASRRCLPSLPGSLRPKPKNPKLRSRLLKLHCHWTTQSVVQTTSWCCPIQRTT